jgi:hypothetical protein
VIVLAVTDSEVGAVPPPTAPVNVAVPEVPAFTVKEKAPLIVETLLAKLMFAPAGDPPPFVVSRVRVDPRETAVLLRVIDPEELVMFPPIAVVGLVPTPV